MYFSTRFKNCLQETKKQKRLSCVYANSVFMISFKLLKSYELAAIMNPCHSFRKPFIFKSDSSKSFHVRCLSAPSPTCFLGPCPVWPS